MKNKKGFTLIELLVVVLIIGILASIALPQYQMAVTKAKVASILPLMRRWKDALMEYNLQHGNYQVQDYESLDAKWPSDWDCSNDGTECSNDYWGDCFANEELHGTVSCFHRINENNFFFIFMHQADESDLENFRDMITCWASGTDGHKVCKALGGELLEEDANYGYYKLN